MSCNIFLQVEIRMYFRPMTSQVCLYMCVCAYVWAWRNMYGLISSATVLLFFKFYDAVRKVLTYVGHSIESLNKKFGNSLVARYKRCSKHFACHIQQRTCFQCCRRWHVFHPALLSDCLRCVCLVVLITLKTSLLLGGEAKHGG